MLKGRKKGIHLRTQAQTWSLIVVLWNPTLELDGPPLPLDSSIRDLQKGNAGYVADALEQPLLLPHDMANLRTLKKH